MGGNNTKTSIISYEDAVKRGEHEVVMKTA
jgi:hypothetical protein